MRLFTGTVLDKNATWKVWRLFSSTSDKPRNADEKVRVTRRQCKAKDTVRFHMASQRWKTRIPKMDLINVLSRRIISEIKLKRTDTTLDLSQKAYKTISVCQRRHVWGVGADVQRELKKEKLKWVEGERYL